MARRTKEEAEQTRRDILQAALDMFCDKGYTRTTIDDIAKSINLTKGAIYWYFRNKPDILKALIVEDFQNTRTKLESYLPCPQTLDELKRHFMFLAELLDKDQNFSKLSYFLMFQMEWSNGLVNSFKDLFEEYRALPRKTIFNALKNEQNSGNIASDIDLDAMACTIHNMWVGLLGDKLCHQDSVCLCETAAFSFDFVINALLSRKD